MEQQVNLDSWEGETKREEISVEEMDKVLTKYEEARTVYETAKKISDGFHKDMEESKAAMLAILEASGKTKWEVEGVGKVSVSEKLTVRVPQDLTGKQQMLTYFRKLGSDQYLALVSVNYMTLNSFYKQECENNPNFRIPGVAEGSVDKVLRLNRARK